MKSEFKTARIDQLAEHPAQMRTLYSLLDMATLTLQVYENDLDEWQPITATPDGKGGYYIISGHRRRMARLFAYALTTWINQPDSEINEEEEGVHIELVKEFIGALIMKYEYVDAAAEALTEHYANEEIEFVLFEGNAKNQILALQRANYGAVKPDMLGIAHSFQAALGAGATITEIARNAGQHAHYVRNHLALNKLPQELAEQIADGHLPMSMGIAVANIAGEHKRNGLALFILSNPPEQLTAKAVKEVAKKIDKWNGLQVPLTCAHQAQRNIARSLTRLWHLVVEAYPVRSWAVISSFIYQDVNIQAPWSDQKAVDLWFKTIGGQHYYGEDGIKWESVVTNLMDEVSCETCPVSKLPTRQLRSDLSPGRSDVLGMPCRSQATGPCLHGLAPNDPFHVRVPWDWAEHEGVEKDASGYVVLSFDNLQKAWQAQAAASGERDDEESENLPQESDNSQTHSDVVSADLTSEEVIVKEHASGAQQVQEAVIEQASSEIVASVPLPTAVPVSSTATEEQEQVATAQTTEQKASPSRPIDLMRGLIASFMEQHLTMNISHPFATPCAKCQHKLMSSPTKDESLPHCAWAGRLRYLQFFQLKPSTAKAIPVCRQFAPKGSWAQIIPAHPQKAIMQREWIKHQIQEVVNKQSPNHHRKMFEFLTGRPMSSDEKHRRWFLDQLNEQAHSLSDEQLWTLMVWALAELERSEIWSTPKWKSGEFTLFMPADSTNTHFVQAHEIEVHEGEFA